MPRNAGFIKKIITLIWYYRLLIPLLRQQRETEKHRDQVLVDADAELHFLPAISGGVSSDTEEPVKRLYHF